MADSNPLLPQRRDIKTGAWIEDVRKSPSGRSGRPSVSLGWPAALARSLSRGSGRGEGAIQRALMTQGKLDLRLNRRSF